MPTVKLQRNGGIKLTTSLSLSVIHQLAKGERIAGTNVLYFLLPVVAPGTSYFASAHGTDTVCGLSCLQPEGSASSELLIPQFDGSAFF